MLKRVSLLFCALFIALSFASCAAEPEEDKGVTRPPVWETGGEPAGEQTGKEPEPADGSPQEQNSDTAPKPAREQPPSGSAQDSAAEPEQKGGDKASLPSGYAKNDSAHFVGVWSCTVDLFDAFDTDDEYIAKNTMPVTQIMEFSADGSYKMYIDPGSMEKAKRETMEKYRVFMIDNAAEYMLENDITEISPEDFLRRQNYDLETCGREFVDGLDTDGILRDYSHEGRFDALDGKLMLSSGKQYAVSSKSYFIYRISGKSFTVTGGTGASADRFLDAFDYPLRFEKR